MGDKTFGRNLKQRRENLGFTLDDLSYIANVERSSISHVEKGDRYYTFENTINVLKALNTTFCQNMENKTKHDLLIDEINEILLDHTDVEYKFFLTVLESLAKLRNCNG